MSDGLPKGWVFSKLGTVVERITKGATPTSYGYPFQSNGIAFIKVENLHNGFVER